MVGGGTTGAVLAARLSEDPARRVLLIEAGPDDQDYPTTVRRPEREYELVLGDGPVVAHVTTIGRASSPTMLVRGEALGGTSAVNFMAAVRTSPTDHARWLDAGATGWGWEDVWPAYCRAETDLDRPEHPSHGHEGPLTLRRWTPSTWHPLHRAVREGALALGHRWRDDLNAPDGAPGVAAFPAAIHPGSGERLTVSQAYLTPAVRSRRNLELRSRCRVTRLRCDGERCSGVVLDDGTVVSAREVIVCAGALASPTLLLRSGIGPADDLRAAGIDPCHDLAAVGARLGDHVGPGIVYRLPGATPLTGSPAQIVWVGPDAEDTGAGSHVLACPIATTATDTFVHVYAFPLAPRARGTVSLTPSAVDGPARIVMPFLVHDDDLADLDATLGLVSAWERTDAFAALGAERQGPAGPLDAPEVRDALLASSTYSYFHQVGTCAMGTDPSTSVVDPDLCVHGLAGLRVADASVMPELPRANTYLACVMIGERLSQRWTDRA